MLEGHNVNLRLLTEADIAPLLTAANTYAEHGEFDARAFLVDPVFRKEFADSGWWRDNQGMMLVTDKLDNMLGHIVFFEGMRHEAGYEVGYTIFRRRDRGRGYMTEALRIFSAYLFQQKPIARLHVKMLKGNVASRRIAEKSGYQLEGTFRRFGFANGQYYDHEVLALLREECPPLAEVLANPPPEAQTPPAAPDAGAGIPAKLPHQPPGLTSAADNPAPGTNP
ncbi:MAG: GNAT family protein [Phycisphaerae bacterium]|jgi:RimJ/RimL family protein N-acetyltransferase